MALFQNNKQKKKAALASKGQNTKLSHTGFQDCQKPSTCLLMLRMLGGSMQEQQRNQSFKYFRKVVDGNLYHSINLRWLKIIPAGGWGSWRDG